jgi:hypothetical protein
VDLCAAVHKLLRLKLLSFNNHVERVVKIFGEDSGVALGIRNVLTQGRCHGGHLLPEFGTEPSHFLAQAL